MSSTSHRLGETGQNHGKPLFVIGNGATVNADPGITGRQADAEIAVGFGAETTTGFFQHPDQDGAFDGEFHA